MNKLILTFFMALALTAPVWAAEMDTAASDKAAAGAVTEAAKPIEVGNKICPVSGEKVGEMGDVVKIEYEGKIYNLCCPMCKKDFKKDPQKYIDKVNAEMKASGAQK